jgi:pyruvate dehydrogenase E2 component (dihydrolipoamide acetyltransferase)
MAGEARRHGVARRYRRGGRDPEGRHRDRDLRGGRDRRAAGRTGPDPARRRAAGAAWPADEAEASARPCGTRTSPRREAQGLGAACAPSGRDPPPNRSRRCPRPPSGAVLASPAARARAAELGIALDAVAGSGPGGAVLLSDVERHVPGTGRPAPDAEPARDDRRASPASTWPRCAAPSPPP